MDIHQLLGQIRLVDVRLIERHATLTLDPSPDRGLAALPDETSRSKVHLEVNPVSWGKRIETWFRIHAENELATIRCAVAVCYERDSDDDISDEVRREFVEKVSVMAAYPYLRAEVQQQSADLRIGVLTLDLLKQGDFKLLSNQGSGSEEAVHQSAE